MTGVETDALHYFSPPTIRPEEIDGRRKSLCGHVVQKGCELGRDGLIGKVFLKEKVARLPLFYRNFSHVACQNTTAQGGQVCREKRASRVVWMEYEC